MVDETQVTPKPWHCLWKEIFFRHRIRH